MKTGAIPPQSFGSLDLKLQGPLMYFKVPFYTAWDLLPQLTLEMPSGSHFLKPHASFQAHSSCFLHFFLLFCSLGNDFFQDIGPSIYSTIILRFWGLPGEQDRHTFTLSWGFNSGDGLASSLGKPSLDPSSPRLIAE